VILRISAIQLRALCANEKIVRFSPQSCQLLGLGQAVSGGIAIGRLISDSEILEVDKSVSGYILLCSNTAWISPWHLIHAAGFICLKGTKMCTYCNFSK
jgi:hypothetical protein